MPQHLACWPLEHWDIKFKFSITWTSSVSLLPTTTSSYFKFVWFGQFKSQHISVFQERKHILLLTTGYIQVLVKTKNVHCRRHLYLYLYVMWQYALLCYRATGDIAPHYGFFGVSSDGSCAYVHWGSFTSNYSSVRRAIWFSWFSKPQDTTSLHACPSVYSTWCVQG